MEIKRAQKKRQHLFFLSLTTFCKKEINVKQLLILIGLSIFTAVACGYAQAESSAARPEVALCIRESGMETELFMIFDLSGSAMLGDKPTEVVILNTPSVEFNPWTFFTREHDFNISLDEKDNKTTEYTTYGSYHFERIKDLGAAVFVRRGIGEKGFGTSVVGGEIWRIDGKKKEQIGKAYYKDVVTPDGEARTLLIKRLQGDEQKGITDIGGKIMQVEADGKMTQVGWVSWRKITTPQGTHLGILMTKSMASDAKWAGRYDGKLYQDK